MAIRRPTVYRENQFIFQDFLFHQDGDTSLRYAVAKYDGEPFDTLASTFDISDPTYSAGSVVARVDYTVSEKLVIIDHWEINWRDEWPLRLTVQFLTNCVYRLGEGYQFRVNKDVYPFWVSENFFPVTNDPFDYLVGN